MNNNRVTKMVLVDVECEWGSVSPYSGRMTEFGAVDFHSDNTFHGVLFDTVTNPVNDVKFTIPEGHDGYDVRVVMSEFSTWLDSLGADRLIFVSDNPAYDFMWIAEAFDRAGLKNPFGHSARRIGDLAAGLNRKWKDQSSWKKHRVTHHDHNPVNDAQGNKEALRYLLDKFDQKY